MEEDVADCWIGLAEVVKSTVELEVVEGSHEGGGEVVGDLGGEQFREVVGVEIFWQATAFVGGHSGVWTAMNAVSFGDLGGVLDLVHAACVASAGDVGEMEMGDQGGHCAEAFPLAEVAVEKQFFRFIWTFHAR